MNLVFRKYLILVGMIIISLPDILWGLYNLLLGGLFFFIGKKQRDSKLMQYGKNIAISVDQFFAAKSFGQSPDITISDALGVAKKKEAEGTAKVDKVWLLFASFVNKLFWFQKDHVIESREHDENNEDSVLAFHESHEPREL